MCARAILFLPPFLSALEGDQFFVCKLFTLSAASSLQSLRFPGDRGSSAEGLPGRAAAAPATARGAWLPPGAPLSSPTSPLRGCPAAILCRRLASADSCQMSRSFHSHLFHLAGSPACFRSPTASFSPPPPSCHDLPSPCREMPLSDFAKRLQQTFSCTSNTRIAFTALFLPPVDLLQATSSSSDVAARESLHTGPMNE